MKNPETQNFKQALSRIKAFAFDVDGVLAASQVLIHPSGEIMRNVNSKDGYAIFHASREGFPVAIITGAHSESIRIRFESLGANEIYLGAADKTEYLHRFADKYNLSLDEILYMGDDIPDIPAMRIAGIACAPIDAAPEAKANALYISPYKSGEGCARDVIEQVLIVHNKWMHNLESFKW